MSRRVALKGETTTTKGEILSGGYSAFHGDRPVARKGDLVFCPVCGVTGTIIQGTEKFVVDKIPVALDNHLVACGCPVGTNRIIAKESSMWVDE